MVLDIVAPSVHATDQLTESVNSLSKRFCIAEQAIERLEVQVQKANLIDQFREDLLKAEKDRFELNLKLRGKRKRPK